jgi:hypothetical protein
MTLANHHNNRSPKKDTPKWSSGAREPAPFSSSLKCKKFEYKYFEKNQKIPFRK